MDKVATLIGEYIADISNYFYANRFVEILDKGYKVMKDELNRIEEKNKKK